jgi:hypothetical protein
MGEDGGLILVGTRSTCVVVVAAAAAVVVVVVVRVVVEDGIRHVYRVCSIRRVCGVGVDASFRQ